MTTQTRSLEFRRGGRVPLGGRRVGLLLVGGALLFGAGLRFVPGEDPDGRHAPDPAALAREFGMPGRAWPLAAPGAVQTGIRFVINDQGRGLPCIAYSSGGHGGGGCFKAIGERGG